MSDTWVGGWTTAPNPGIFHLFVIPGYNNPFGPIINGGTDQPISIPLSDGVYSYTLLGNDNAGSTFTNPVNLTLYFSDGPSTGSINVSTVAAGGSTVIGATRLTVADFKFKPFDVSPFINRVTNHFVGPSGPEGTHNDAVAQFTLLVSSDPCAPAPATDFPNLVSWWRAENNPLDSFDGNHGSLQGPVGFAPGRVGQAFSFNGTDGYVRVPASANLPSGNSPRTFAAWVYTRPSSWVDNVNTVFHYGGQSTRQSFSLDMRPWPNMEFYTWSDDIVFNAGVPQEGWVHIAITYDGNTATVYTQGQVRGSKTYSSGLNTANTGLDIGRIPPPFSPSYFDGLIDEFAIYNRALTPVEIHALASVDTTPPVITLNGPNPMTIECPNPYVEPGATATDNCDPNPTLTITGSVNSNAVGTYIITYTTKDHSGNTATATRTVNVVAPPPPFSIDKPLPNAEARLCLPPFMVQDPFTIHKWWARATGVGNLEIQLIAFAVNATETGSATIKVFDPSGTQVLGSPVTVNHPATGETPATPVVISGAAAGALYRIEVSVGPSSPPSPTAQARHYRLELKGASMLGANSPLQAQSEHDDARWAVNVGTGEPLDVTVKGGPEAGATMATVEVRKPDGTLATTIGPAAPLPISVNLSGAGASPGMWTVSVLGASRPSTPPDPPVPPVVGGHYIIDKTTGADRGLYVTWETWGFGTISGNITLGGAPNSIPVIVEIKNPLTGAVVRTISGVTSSYTANKVPIGNYTVQVIIPPPNLQELNPIPASVNVTLTCDGTATANFVLNRPPTCNGTPSIAEIWPPNHKMVNVNIQGVSDPDGDPVTITITGIRQDEPLNTLGDGNFEPDGAIVNNGSTAQVRAERSGTPRVPGNGRCYHITFTASDGQGGTCGGVVRTCVPHDQAHPAVDDGPIYNSLGGAPKPVAAFEPEAEADLTFGAENYPNPFNPSTTIRYTLPEASSVRLTIYNVLGQEIRTLVNAAQPRGVHSVQWDGRDAYGRQAATGVYIYRLEAGSYVATRNMVFTK